MEVATHPPCGVNTVEAYINFRKIAADSSMENPAKRKSRFDGKYLLMIPTGTSSMSAIKFPSQRKIPTIIGDFNSSAKKKTTVKWNNIQTKPIPALT